MLCKYTVLVVLVFIIGIFSGWTIKDISIGPSFPVRQVSEDLPGYKYINPLLYIEGKENSAEYKPLDRSLNDYISKATSQNLADSISVYFRDLNRGEWTGVNEEIPL